jgi:hypothetical protein
MALNIQEAQQCIHGVWLRWNSRMVYYFDPIPKDSTTGKLCIGVINKTTKEEYEYELKCAISTLKLRMHNKWFTIVSLDATKQTLKIVDDDIGKELLFTNAHTHVQSR